MSETGLIDWEQVIDLPSNAVNDTIGSMAEEKTKNTRGASRYDAVIATFVGLCALCVSGYTAYIQRQQVRAAVWPILQFDSSNAPDIRFTLANKGVGPAIIRNVIVKVDGQPVRNWKEVMERLLGPGEHLFSESDMSGHVVAAGESMVVFTAHNAQNSPLVYDRSNPLWVQLNKERFRVAVEICYSSTLNECWTLHADGTTPSTTTAETNCCSTPSAISFQQ